MASALNQKHFKDEAAAYRWVEERVWPEGRICPHCGVVENSGPLKGKSTRIGVYKCYACRKPFTVKVGTIFEASHIPLHIWLQAMFLLASSKKGISSNQLARTLGVTLKSAWFLSHRIREAMKGVYGPPFGSDGGAVEVDETFFGENPEATGSGRGGYRHLNAVMTLVGRSSGRAKSVVMSELNAETIGAALRENLAKEARLYTDEARHYMPPGKEYAEHRSVAHARGEFYSKDDPTIHTQTVENYYSVFKRGMRGTYQHCARRHLHRYCAEFDFRYSNRVKVGVDDAERFARIVRSVTGKRLTYKAADREARNLT